MFGNNITHNGGFFGGGGGFGGGFGGFGGAYGGGGGGGIGLPPRRRFEEQYHCYSVAYADKSHLEKGDKILLPPSAFDTLARLQVDYPMLFRLQSHVDQRTTHCGVLEFTAEEGTCYIPFWMMQNLLIEEGSVITVTNVSLPKATFVKLQPQSVDFLEISNPRAVLEHALRNFSCVTKGDIIQVPYNNRNYHLALKDVQPQDAACIIETDCNVDFDAPEGYQEPEYNKPNAGSTTSSSTATGTGSNTHASMMASKNNQEMMQSSACPSPATLSAASSVTNLEGTIENNGIHQHGNPTGTRIVNGEIVRPNDNNAHASSMMLSSPTPKTELLAERVGTTGVQRNAATIPQHAPDVDYWAVNAGDGARLDGKSPSVLKDKEGKEVDIRKLRAEAAAARRAAEEAAAAAAAAESSSSKLLSSTGKNLRGEEVPPDTEFAAAANAAASTSASTSSSSSLTSPSTVSLSKRKTKVGSKFSRLKQSGVAFQGSANNLK